MRFLCLHGKGTNSKIFASQTAALRYELGDQHTYDFVEGSIPCEPMIPANVSLSAAEEGDGCFYQYLDATSWPSCARAVHDLESYMALHGPYDGFLAFSQGAALAAYYILSQTLQAPPSTSISTSTSTSISTSPSPSSISSPPPHPPLQLAIFLAGGTPVDPAAFRAGKMHAIDVDAHAGAIGIPTAHVWGERDVEQPPYGAFGPPLARLCDAGLRSVFVHGGGHEVPGRKDAAGLRGAVRVVRRTVERAEVERAEVEGEGGSEGG